MPCTWTVCVQVWDLGSFVALWTRKCPFTFQHLYDPWSSETCSQVQLPDPRG